MKSTTTSDAASPRPGSPLRPAWIISAVVTLATTPLLAQAPPEPTDPRACVAIVTDAERLACYDRAFARDQDAEEPEAIAESTIDSPDAEATADDGATSGLLDRPFTSLLDRRWELFPESKLGTFSMRAHKPVYILPYVVSRKANQTPSSPAPGRSVTSSERLDDSELKFQLSIKTKAWQGVFGEVGDLWLGYTQSSRWQLYNAERSRPFRETNYEPEAMLVFRTKYRLGGWHGRLFSIGLNHASNGRDNPRSRSWNRVIASFGLEREGWTLTFRPWWRIPEGDDVDDNPDIEDHIGRADLLLVRHVRNHEVSALFRHSLRGGDRSRGAVQLDWAFPIHGNLRAHVQAFHGYGESLIDYNFKTTQIGLGLSLLEWY